MPKDKQAQYYKQVDIKTRVDAATSHGLIQMLFEGILGEIAAARGALDREDYTAKGDAVNRAVDILSGLRESLNHDVEGSLPYNLDNLYTYMQKRLLEFHSTNDKEALEEIAGLLQTIKSGWDEISSN